MRVLVLALAMVMTLCGAAGAQPKGVFVVPDPAKLKWVPFPFDKRIRMACILGDPGEAGSFVVLLRFPPGDVVPPHQHPTAEELTVISGSVNFGLGASAKGKTQVLRPGGYLWMPPNSPHFGWTKRGVLVQVKMMGPLAVDFASNNRPAPLKPGPMCPP